MNIVAEKNENLHKLGTISTCLGGLLVILNLTVWKNNNWGLELATLAVGLVFLGIVLMNKAKGSKTE